MTGKEISKQCKPTLEAAGGIVIRHKDGTVTEGRFFHMNFNWHKRLPEWLKGIVDHIIFDCVGLVIHFCEVKGENDSMSDTQKFFAETVKRFAEVTPPMCATG